MTRTISRASYFRSEFAAASLKQRQMGEGGQGEANFRSEFAAASLKLDRIEAPELVDADFRSEFAAASLKRCWLFACRYPAFGFPQRIRCGLIEAN